MKKIIITIIFISLFFGLWQTAQAEQSLIVNYPEIDNTTLGAETPLPQLIKYIYLFSLGIVGFMALLSILIGAIKYTTSAGDASKTGEAKEQITQALLGVLILLTAVLLLNIINPDLIKLKADPPEVVVIPIVGDQTNDCQFIDATFGPTELNTGESATLTLKFSQACIGQEFKYNSLRLEQPEYKLNWLLKKKRCKGFIRQNDLTTTNVCEFKKGWVGNFNNNIAESFILKGSIKVVNGDRYYLTGNISIVVNDLKPNGDCCK